MMYKNCLFAILLLLTINSSAQQKKSFISVGTQISLPGYTLKTQTNAVGIGIDVKREQFFSKKFLWTVSAGFNYFIGNYYFHDFGPFSVPNPEDETDTLTNFHNLYVLGGIKYYPIDNLYASIETGAVFNYGVHPAIVPSIGLTLPVRKFNQIDIGVRLTKVLELPSIPENNSLQRGNYGFWSLRLAYGF